LVIVETITGCYEEEAENYDSDVYDADEVDPEGESVVNYKVL
jgi:hypothetical protein